MCGKSLSLPGQGRRGKVVPWGVFLNEVQPKSERFGARSEVAMKIFSWIQGRQAVAVPGVRNVPSWKEPNFPSHLAQAAGTCVN